MSGPSRCAATNGSLECELAAGHDQGPAATPHETRHGVAWCPWKTDAEMKAWVDDLAMPRSVLAELNWSDE